jgi:hypothetical protein
MATSNLVDASMVLTFDAGVDLNGKPVVKRKSFNSLKAQVTNDQLYAVATAIIPLQAYPIIVIERDDTTELTA